MSTRNPKRGTTKSSRPKETAIAKKFKDTPHRIIMYNQLPTVPDELDWRVVTYANSGAAGATASISQYFFSNSLLHSSDSFNGAHAQNPTLPKVALNYTKYRVVGYRMHYTLMPRDTSGDVNLTILHTASDPAYSSAVGFLGESALRDKSQYFLVPASTKSPCVIRGTKSFQMARIIGEKEYQQDDSYAGTVDSAGVFTSPADLTYITFYQAPSGGGSFTAGNAVRVQFIIEQFVRFYDKRY